MIQVEGIFKRLHEDRGHGSLMLHCRQKGILFFKEYSSLNDSIKTRIRLEGLTFDDDEINRLLAESS
jgi:hypothetical protein